MFNIFRSKQKEDFNRSIDLWIDAIGRNMRHDGRVYGIDSVFKDVKVAGMAQVYERRE